MLFLLYEKIVFLFRKKGGTAGELSGAAGIQMLNSVLQDLVPSILAYKYYTPILIIG